jgi:hypothetical protein
MRGSGHLVVHGVSTRRPISSRPISSRPRLAPSSPAYRSATVQTRSVRPGGLPWPSGWRRRSALPAGGGLTMPVLAVGAGAASSRSTPSVRSRPVTSVRCRSRVSGTRQPWKLPKNSPLLSASSSAPSMKSDRPSRRCTGGDVHIGDRLRGVPVGHPSCVHAKPHCPTSPTRAVRSRDGVGRGPATRSATRRPSSRTSRGSGRIHGGDGWRFPPATRGGPPWPTPRRPWSPR